MVISQMVKPIGRGSLFGFALAALILICAPFAKVFASHPGFDPNNLISDSEFVDIDNMSADEIQRFLNQQNSYLKDFSEDSRSAAQIIWDAAHGHGEASNNGGTPINGILIDTTTGTVNPKVILVTLQKEQSLISKTTRDDTALRKAMGYGCPDSGSCSATYAGFTKQVENAAWQFRYNYERAQGKGTDKTGYQVGDTQSLANADGSTTNVTFANAATASLYRYTPHVYNGNHNFNNLYINTYNFQAREYDATPAGWSSSDGSFVYPSVIAGGQGTNFSITVKNTGRTTWSSDIVHLATSSPRDRVSNFLRESGTGASSGWVSPNRIKMQESSVAPGSTATFSFWEQAPAGMSPGTYRERFELVADGVSWFSRELGIYWDVTVLTTAQSYTAAPDGWSSSDGSFVYPAVVAGGQGTNLVITLKNTGKTTWNQDVVHLGTASPRDRVSNFLRESGTGASSGWVSPNRIKMQESSVAPGSTATFSFWEQAPAGMSPGTYRERFELVADGVSWFSRELGIYWDVTVR